MPARTATATPLLVTFVALVALLAASCTDNADGAEGSTSSQRPAPTQLDTLDAQVATLDARLTQLERALEDLTADDVARLRTLLDGSAALASGAPHASNLPRCGDRFDPVEHFIRLESGRWGGIEIIRCER